MKREKLTKEILEDIFSIYRELTGGNWGTPGFSYTGFKLKNSKFFEFKDAPVDRWSSKFVIRKEEDKLSFEFLINENNPMREKMIPLKEKFNEGVKAYLIKNRLS